MTGREALVIYLFIASCVVCASALTIPSQSDFLCELFNATVEEVKTIAKEFQFRTDVSSSEISIIQVFNNGTNASYLLSDLIAGSKTLDLYANIPIVLITHGWKGSGNDSWIGTMAKDFHKIGKNNTLAVSWTTIADKGYIAASNATQNVGQLVGKWLVALQSKGKFSFTDIQLVGHSLGGHVSGFIGKTVTASNKTAKIQRITGLDVAAPLFEYPIESSTDKRLSSTDAVLVEAYHTDKGLLGFLSPIGKNDFYVNNGGPIQPGCGNLNIFTAISCSHSFSHEFFAKSIGNDDYIAKECPYFPSGYLRSCSHNLVVTMGQDNNGTSINGTFYGNTDSEGNPAQIS